MENKLKYRPRVETLVLNPRGEVYGGRWLADRTFGIPGGGIDPGEDPQQAALRELLEEAGIVATDPELLSERPVRTPWRKIKIKDGVPYRGAVTHHVLARALRQLKNKELEEWLVEDKGYYPISRALEMMHEGKPRHPALWRARKAALEQVLRKVQESKDKAIQKTAVADSKSITFAKGIEMRKYASDKDEKKEKQRRNRRLLAAAAALASIGGGGLLAAMLLRRRAQPIKKKPEPMYSLEDWLPDPKTMAPDMPIGDLIRATNSIVPRPDGRVRRPVSEVYTEGIRALPAWPNSDFSKKPPRAPLPPQAW